jgi:hypothetical protein
MCDQEVMHVVGILLLDSEKAFEHDARDGIVSRFSRIMSTKVSPSEY